MLRQNCEEFAAKIASKEPVPGGGGASAYVGAIGVALGAMVGNLTSGKAKYADVQEEIEALIEKSEALRAKLQSLVDEDARLFLPLVKAYGMPAATEAEQAAKAAALEDALKAACEVPLAIMAACCEGIGLNAEYAEKGSRLAVSDAGAGAVFCKAALVGASLNVFINTKLMTDRVCAERMERDANTMIEQYGRKADAVLELAFERM